MEDLLQVSSKEKDEIYKYYTVSSAEIKDMVEILKKWLEKQPHLPQNITDKFIEGVLLRNKFRVERSKEKLDNYYTLRGANLELINFEIADLSKCIYLYLPLPKLTPTLERIIISKPIKPLSQRCDFITEMKITIAFQELLLHYDAFVGVRFIVDLENFTLQHITGANPILLQKTLSVTQKALSQRLLGIEIINGPSLVGKMVTLLKLVLHSKFHSKIRQHPNLESLHEIVPKECLPKQYGGTVGDIFDLKEKWDVVLKSYETFLKENAQNVSSENLRPADSNYGDTAFGVDGTFKKLSID